MTTVPQPPSDRTRCQKVIEQARNRLLDMLYAFADGLTPKQVARRFTLSIKTVDGYKTDLLKLCRTVWNIPADAYLDYHFLREKFAWLGEAADNATTKRVRMYCQ